MNNTIVLFDVGAVLLELNYTSVYNIGSSISKRSLDEYKRLSSELEVDALNGSISYEEHQRRLRQLLKKPDMTKDELEGIVKLTWVREITPVVDLKEKVYFKENCPVNIFSNIDRFAFECLSRTYPRMMQTFRPDAVPICSYSSKGTKPKSQNMYMDGVKSAKALGCDKVILIDDKESILQVGIEQFNWFGIHFTPFIDPNEAIRLQSPTEASFTSDRLFVADTVEELENVLGLLIRISTVDT